jgi:hypothetical protein
MHKDEMQARSEPSTAPHFVRGDKVIVVTKNHFLRGQHHRKLRDRQLGPFTIEEQIEKHNYIFEMLATVRLHHVFHVNNLRPCFTPSLWRDVPKPTLEGDDDEFEVSHISVVCINSFHGRRGMYLLFMTQFNDEDIPPVWHRLNEVKHNGVTRFHEDAPMAHVYPY